MKKLTKAIHKNRFHIKLASHFLDILYPHFCIICGCSGYDICPTCKIDLNAKIEKRDPCKICGINLRKQKCICRRGEEQFYTKSFSLFDFDEDLKKIVYQFKYNGMHKFANKAVGFINNSIVEDLLDDVDIIVPVPLHFSRKIKRGYNQAEKLANGVFGDQGIPIMNLLKRKRSTGTQTALAKDERQANLEGAISINKKYNAQLNGKIILLVDDVITTGATCNICSKILIESNAKEVRLFSLARA